MYPLKFKSILKEKIWGSESWSISTIPGDESIVAEGEYAGQSLSMLIKLYGKEILGQDEHTRFGNEFPLLVKFIDAQEPLSIQVHPNEELAKFHHNSHGKSEMWYVMDNENDKGSIYIGFKHTVSPVEYEKMIHDDSICDALAYYKVKEGDIYYLPAGRIHSIGAGCKIAEIQQPSDITYRIYDFNRLDSNGKPRDLHTEYSREAIDYTVQDEYRTIYEKASNQPVSLVECPYFTTYLYDLTENMAIDYSEFDAFIVYVCVGGSCTITDDKGYTTTLKSDESIIIPATTRDILISVKDGENVKIIETYICD